MKNFLRGIGLVVALILVLSITVKNRTIFEHIYAFISPATKSAQNMTERFLASSLNSTERYSKKLFDNSVPKMKDSVRSKLASPDREATAPLEDVSTEDREQLDELIKSHR